MTVYVDWYGGSSYAVGGPEYREVFPSLKAAGEAFWSRYQHGYAYRQTFVALDGTVTEAFTPCVDMESVMHIHATPDSDYPDRVIRFGPRGGIRMESV